ncbi:membrane-spanning 4-domains subfamily A member 6D-like [Phodopus roborovskii]|uniref:membrane-spanning 4-domains subfamily A member 6D-like n=1 Tax=Phodopus roborovskii TaxID=109678 RepID=UPI0021E4A1F9|nr:membrane-spanning 4-domains subfamily A member 6D-like [Phodopus roborovskii]
MIPQVVTNETDTVISTNEIKFPQTDNPQPVHQRQGSLQKHLRAEVKVMAAIQIMCGVMVLCLGIILASAPNTPHFTPVFSVLLKSGHPFVGSLFFVVSGILSVITEKKTTKPLVHRSLALSILSALFALTGIIILSTNLASLDSALQQCKLMAIPQPATTTSYYHYLRPNLSDKNCFKVKATLTGTFSLMLICTVLELGLAVITAIVWWNQGHSDFSGNVIFLSRDSKKNAVYRQSHFVTLNMGKF